MDETRGRITNQKCRKYGTKERGHEGTKFHKSKSYALSTKLLVHVTEVRQPGKGDSSEKD